MPSLVQPIAVIAACLSLSGCQSLFGHVESAWNWSERQVASGWQEVASALRPAPRTQDVFLPAGADWNSDTGDAMLNTPRLEARLEAVTAADVPEPVRVAVDRSYDNGVLVVRPGAPRSRSTFPQVPVFDAAPPQQQPTVALPNYAQNRPVASDPYSYVRLDGPTRMEDWQGCEAATGGAFLVSETGVAIANDFDACMRGRGYLPEAEAERWLRERSGERLAGGS